MVFNTWLFFFFFAAVLLLYVQLNRRAQNLLLLVASCYFYGCWDWRFLFLVGFSTLIDYWTALRMESTEDERKRWGYLMLSVTSNLIILGFFKYFNFFADGLYSLLSLTNSEVNTWRLDIILPVGISFYTFHALSYSIDVYRRDLAATHNFLDFALFVMFFPQLVAGPIGRASHQLPQFLKDRRIVAFRAREGCWLILWGMFKKVCVADNLAVLVDANFARSADLNGLTAYLTVVAFAYQIYCDFSGYTDIARGVAQIMGFDILKNFKRPYAAVNPSDFWRRWHISLSSWLRDYLYIPLGGNRYGMWFTYRNLIITMVLGGLWHGAAWNFVWWGVFHGLLLVAYQATSRSVNWRIPRWFSMVVMFQLTLLGWLLFRCNRQELVGRLHVDQSWDQIREFLTSPQRGFAWNEGASTLCQALALFVLPLVFVEWCIPEDDEDRGFVDRPRWQSTIMHAAILFYIVRYGVQNAGSFIYFQF